MIIATFGKYGCKGTNKRAKNKRKSSFSFINSPLIRLEHHILLFCRMALIRST